MQNNVEVFIEEYVTLHRRSPTALEVYEFLHNLPIPLKEDRRRNRWACKIVAVLVILGLCVGVSLHCAIEILLHEMEPWIKHTERHRSAVGMDLQYVDGQHPVGDLLLRSYGQDPSATTFSEKQITKHRTTVVEPTEQIFEAAMRTYNVSSYDVFVNFHGLTVYLVHQDIFDMVEQDYARYNENFVHDDTLWGIFRSSLNFPPRIYRSAMTKLDFYHGLCVPFNEKIHGVFCSRPHAVYVALTENNPFAVDILVHEVSHALFSTMDLLSEPSTNLVLTFDMFIQRPKYHSFSGRWDILLTDLLDSILAFPALRIQNTSSHDWSIGAFTKSDEGMLMYAGQVASHYWFSPGESRVHVFMLMLLLDGIMKKDDAGHVCRHLYWLYSNDARIRNILDSLIGIIKQYFGNTHYPIPFPGTRPGHRVQYPNQLGDPNPNPNQSSDVGEDEWIEWIDE